MNLQELYFISLSTYQFTPYSYKNTNTAVSTTKCTWLALLQYMLPY